MKHPPATKLQAHSLFQQGWRVADIAREVGVSERTIREWRDIGGWVQTLTPEEAVAARMTWLIARDDKTQKDWREVVHLAQLRKKYLRKAEQGQGDGGKRKSGRSRSNEVGHVDVRPFLAGKAGPKLFSYQLDFMRDKARLCWVVKARQIGFTMTASWKALLQAIETGNNQIFLSASKNQVSMFRDYVRDMARDHLDLNLKGNKDRIELHKDGGRWATVYFLSTNTATAQSYHGDVTIDEACWIPQFATLHKTARAMASQKRFRTTVFSTPSTVEHPAWQEYERLRKQQAATPSDRVSLTQLTIYDAMERGCDLFDLDDLREEYDEGAFAQLFECQPIDDELSVFKLRELEALQSDPADWKAPPAGYPVWIGYDPSRTRDSATLQVVVKKPDGWLRLYRRESFKGKALRWQAERIRHYCEEFNVQHVAVDVTGMGMGVYELVCEFFPRATAINYTLENKVALVNCMRHLVSDGRLELPAGDTFLIHAFLAIKQTVTGGGRITYKASRTAETGHADAFFAAAHACQFEPIRQKRRRALVIG